MKILHLGVEISSRANSGSWEDFTGIQRNFPPNTGVMRRVMLPTYCSYWVIHLAFTAIIKVAFQLNYKIVGFVFRNEKFSQFAYPFFVIGEKVKSRVDQAVKLFKNKEEFHKFRKRDPKLVF